jgi:hypothetical protein
MATVFLTISRTTLLGGNLPITLNVTGTATPGVDYNFTAGFDSYASGQLVVTIPTGQLSQIVTIDTVGSPVSQITATFTIAGSGSYLGITPDVQTLTINPSPVGDYADLVVPQPVLAYGLRRIRSSYTGFACQLIHSVSGAVLNVPFLSNGIIDIPLVQAFAGINSARLNIWYNQGTAGGLGDAGVDGAEVFLVRNGVFQLKNGVPVLLQRDTRIIFPTTTTLGSGLQNVFLSYVGGFAGSRAGRMFTAGTSWVFGYDSTGSGKSGVFAYNAAVPAGIPIFPGESILRCYSMNTPDPMAGTAESYENTNLFFVGGQSQLPVIDIRSNGTSSQHSHSFVGEFVAYNVRLLPAQVTLIRNPQMIYFST